MARALLFVPLTLSLFSATARAQLGTDSPDSTRPVQWRVMFTEDPAHRAVVAWTTEDDGVSTLYWDTQPHGGALAEYANTMECTSGRYSLSLHYYHHCSLTGLAPATSYYFVTETENDVSREFYFVTAHDDGRPFKLMAGGDSRSDRDQRRIMNDTIRALFEQHPDVVAFAHGGDYIEMGYSFGQFNEWMTDNELTIASDGRILPIIASRGNHEGSSDLMDQVFAEPGGAGTNYYTTVIGDYWFITLNTETSMAGDQRLFLEQQLQQAHLAEACFISAQYHRPAFPGVKDPSEARAEWVPLFEQYDADLILESDGHILKRTVPIRNEAEDPTGVIYVGEGGLGVSQRTPVTDRWFIQGPNAFAASQHHVILLDVSRTELAYRAIAPDLTVVDSVTLTSRRCMNTLEVKTPAQGAVLESGADSEITWITGGWVPTVDVDWSTDDGSTWMSIASGLANAERAEWTVPEVATTTGRVRVRSTAGAPEGVSGGFTIALPEKEPDPPEMPPPPPPDEQPNPMDMNGAADPIPQPENEVTTDPAVAEGCACTETERGAGSILGLFGIVGLLFLRRRR
jgi:acid phosphatase type 7